MFEIAEIINPMLCLSGIIFLIFGAIMYFFPPKKINGWYGYRTGGSMKNQKNWDFAQKYGAKVMMIFGLIMTVLSPIKGIFNTSEEVDIALGMFILIIGAFAMIPIVEKGIKKNE
ncbi:SdpI family protein [Avrilella dinanensis]|uniref:SdpI/YhfL protein family n=1 Tax=Avrilella dinanensis TaxID=2008672 RepID=A0A2M9R4M4_9FLAO|nr:SdpI family protein [Avrilella dinanensis]PJR03820.1 hypothetical protein CDL10_04235 [Avrilella dinanensis]